MSETKLTPSQLVDQARLNLEFATESHQHLQKQLSIVRSYKARGLIMKKDPEKILNDSLAQGNDQIEKLREALTKLEEKNKE